MKKRWGMRTTGGYHQEDEKKTLHVDTLNFEIGVSLYFSNNRLRGWRAYSRPLHDAPKDTNVINYRDLGKAEGGNNIPTQPGNGPSLGDEPVAVSISGCQTLQESLDGWPGQTDAVITVRRRGRAVEEICETLGQGCKSCTEAPRQMGKTAQSKEGSLK